jgi:hypothetical protein
LGPVAQGNENAGTHRTAEVACRCQAGIDLWCSGQLVWLVCSTAGRAKNNKEKWEKNGPEMHIYELLFLYPSRSDFSCSHAMASPMDQGIHQSYEPGANREGFQAIKVKYASAFRSRR